MAELSKVQRLLGQRFPHIAYGVKAVGHREDGEILRRCASAQLVPGQRRRDAGKPTVTETVRSRHGLRPHVLIGIEIDPLATLLNRTGERRQVWTLSGDSGFELRHEHASRPVIGIPDRDIDMQAADSAGFYAMRHAVLAEKFMKPPGHIHDVLERHRGTWIQIKDGVVRTIRLVNPRKPDILGNNRKIHTIQ